MKMNSKGEGGFMESMVAVVVVIISLTAFLSFLAFSVSHDSEKEAEIPLEMLSGVRIAGGSIEADGMEERMTAAIERHGYIGMRVILSATDGIFDSKVTFNAGIQDSDIIRSGGGTIIVPADDGRSVPVNYTVAVWS